MRRLRPFLLAVLLAGLLCPAGAHAAPPKKKALDRRIAERIKAAKPAAGSLGLLVVDLRDGTVVASLEADRPLVPASVAKLVTAAAALDLLGPGHQFVTTLEARGTLDPATGTLAGDLYLRGSGDPNLSRRERESDPLWPLSALAKAAADAGVKRVTGALVLDDGAFDRSFTHPNWSPEDLGHWYGAPVSGLSWNDGCVTVLVRGAQAAGSPARVLAPSTAGPWPIDAAVTTWERGRDTVVDGAWSAAKRLRVTGGIAPGIEYQFDEPVPDPIAFTGAATLAALSAAGVRVAGGARPAATAADRAPASVLGTVKHGLPETLRVMNRRSQNFYASLVFKACGVEHEGVGTWESGERAIRAVLEARGACADGLRVVDGSGLSRKSRLSAASLVRLLVAFDADPLRGPILRDSLAIPGEDGTLRRMRDPRARARVRAKTGTLKGVGALAGYVDREGGAPGHAFAVIGNKADGRDVAEDIVTELLDG
ncbi:MAG TPA: D-alanyl-D-alanine carboxypeptidase/D-alanyl-D-alanine-endopeptidase [Planctomycetota bacterium]|nr:D-alanyl-D-alanine carboxypeptidase/D-alanyl-D-alanine-endopeptidase [Planctomycetota bacterium]